MSYQKDHYTRIKFQEIDCLISIKRKHVQVLKDEGARWIYRLEDTDFYLIYVAPRRNYYRRNPYTWEPPRVGKWMWYRAKSDYHGAMKSIEQVDFCEVLDDSNVPTEILFHLDHLRRLAQTSQ